MAIRSIAVFCGSGNGNQSVYAETAAALGKLLAEKHIRLIYGGGNTGLMGAVADATMQHGGAVTGVVPEVTLIWERAHKGITELLTTEDMHARKKKIYSLADAGLVLPGGHGTLDEFFEMLTWNQLSIHDKRIFILNTNGFYDHLLAHIDHMHSQGFLYEDPKKRITVLNKPEDLLPYTM